MSTELWRQLSREAGFSPSTDGEIVVALGAGRQQRVNVEPETRWDLIRLWAIAARRADLATVEELPSVFAWIRNRHSDLVGFKIDQRGRLVGEAWVATAGLNAEEWALWVRSVAQACDRMEYLLTGKDER
jgi:hypothetical protein